MGERRWQKPGDLLGFLWERGLEEDDRSEGWTQERVRDEVKVRDRIIAAHQADQSQECPTCRVPGPCPTLLALVQPYRGHNEFDVRRWVLS